MKSDYQWIWSGELVRFVINTVLSLGVTLAVMALSGSVDLTDARWMIGPASAAALGIVQYIQGKLPAKTGA